MLLRHCLRSVNLTQTATYLIWTLRISISCSQPWMSVLNGARFSSWTACLITTLKMTGKLRGQSVLVDISDGLHDWIRSYQTGEGRGFRGTLLSSANFFSLGLGTLWVLNHTKKNLFLHILLLKPPSYCYPSLIPDHLVNKSYVCPCNDTLSILLDSSY